MLAHMFSRKRQQREEERKERLEEIFRKADPFQEGRLTVEQVYRTNDKQHVNHAHMQGATLPIALLDFFL